MINTDRQDVDEQEVCHNGKCYKKTMYWQAGDLNPKLTKPSNAQKKVLRELLDKMKRKLPPPESYRQKATEVQSYTIVKGEGDERSYRIDNQMKLKTSDRHAKLDIQYQIGGKSYAMVEVWMKPTECPGDIIDQVGLIDEDKTFSFSPEAVMGLIEKALQYSADEKCYTYIKWTIEERKRCESCTCNNNDLYAFGKKKSVSIATAKIAVKVTEKTTKLGLKKVQVGSKKVPVVGLVCAAGCSIYRLKHGDNFGAAVEMISGVASCFPPGGTVASYIIDAGLFAFDMIRL